MYLIKKIPAWIILIILPFLLFYRSFTGNIIVAGDFSGSDLLDLHLPFKYSLHELIKGGELPLWQRQYSLGFPFLAEGQTGIFYPVNLILGLLEPYLALNLSIIIAFTVAAVGTYLYCRRIELNKFSSVFSAVVFSQSAFFITRIKHLNMTAVAAWFPFGLWSIKRLFDTGSSFYVVLLGLVIGSQFLIGHPQMAFFCIFIYLIYFIFETVKALKPDKDVPFGPNDLDSKPSTTLLSAVHHLTIAIVTGLGISAIQLIPTLELVGLTERTSYTYGNAVSYPFTLKSLITFISPFYFGNPAIGTYSLNIYYDGVFWENCSYIGLLPFALFIFGMIYILKRWRLPKKKNDPYPTTDPKYLKFFLTLGFICLFLMLGGGTPLYKMLWENIPGFNLFRFPNRFNLFLIFSMSVIAGSSAEILLSKLLSLKAESAKDNVPDEISLSWPLGRYTTGALILGLVIADLAVFAYSYIGYFKASDFIKTPAIVDRLKKDPDQFRIYSLTQYGQSPYQIMGWKNVPETIISLNSSVAPNKNIFYGLDSFTDRGWFEGGLGLSRRNKLENYLLYENKDEVAFGKILGLYNVKYLINFGDVPAIEMFTEEEFDLGRSYVQKLKLIRNDQVMPRTYFVPEAKVVGNAKEAFDNIISISHLSPKTVILEDKPEIIPPNFNGSLDNFKKGNPVTVKSYNNNKIVIDTDTKEHGFLVLSDLYYPGWKVNVDGKEERILRANYLVRAVELDPGKHTVRFYYDPLSFKIGIFITVTTILVISFSAFTLHFKKRSF